MEGRVGVIALLVIITLAKLVEVQADVYLMWDGGNNRLDEANRDRNNGNRLWDSQNNNRGGRNHGTFGRLYYHDQSIVRIEWTNQHSCGNPNANCDFILQYYCDNNVTRDGTTTTTIPDVTTSQTNCLLGDCDADTKYGRHESYQSYQMCKWRSRNKGLWTSTQDMSNGRDGAIYTRQNNNGDRHGYECPEERDYYPYWHPTEWRDIAIITNDTSRCESWQSESQNVKDRYYCKVPQSYIDSKVGTNPATMNNGPKGFIPITQEKCESVTVGGTWTKVESWKIPAPECIQSQWTRDNHLGNTFGGETPHYLWTIPSTLFGESCVFRLRYNITTSETRDGGEWFDDTSALAGNLNSTRNYKYIAPPAGVTIDQNNDAVTTSNPRFFKWADQLDVWTRYGFKREEVVASFDPTLFYSDNFMVQFPSRGYVFRNDPVVDIFGSWKGVPRSTLPQTNSPLPTVLIPLRLALDTSQYGRTFEDRTHTFSIRRQPAALAASSTKKYNIGVRGKRGNIVQTYPNVEYDFQPSELTINQGDWIHFQWTGSNTNPGNNAGQGTAGTDRNNIVVLRQYGNSWAPQVTNLKHGPFQGTINNGEAHISNWKLNYPSRIDDTGVDFLGLSFDAKRALAIGGIYSPYFDLPPQQAAHAGVFNYMCTRNNAFTNRGEKAQITVLPVANAAALMSTASAATARLISPSGASWIRYAPDPLGPTTNSQINIEDLADGRILVTPFLFDTIPGQKVMLDMTYDDRPLTDAFIYQSQWESYNGDEMPEAVASNGVISVQITRGGYYHVEEQASASAVSGLVVGSLAFVGLVGFGYWKLNKKFHIRDKKYIEASQQATA